MPTAAEAYLQNLTWRAINDPGSLSSSEAPYAQQILSTQDAARESAKYQAAFSQPRDDTMVNSSSAYNALVQQYASSRNRVVSSGGSVYQGEAAKAANPYQKDTAAYIAYEVGKTGGAVGIGVAQRALGQGVSPQDIYVAGEGVRGRTNVRASDVLSGVAPVYSLESGRSTVQGDRRQQELTERAMRLVQENVLLSQGRLPERMLPVVPSAFGVGTLYVPFGERTQQEIKNVSAVIYDPLGGAFGGYQTPKSIYGVEGGFQRKYAIQSFGGGTGALQSGMFSTKPLTADIRTQENFAKYAAGADIAAAEAIRASPERYSRLGAELYGGRVSLLATDLLTNKPLALTDRPSVEMGRYAASTGNLANLVDPFGVNRPKEELAVSQIPWQTATRGFSTVTREGVIAPTSKAELTKIGIQSGTLVKTQDRFLSSGPDVEFAGPAPFVSSPTETQVIRPTGEIAVPFTDAKFTVPGISGALAFFQPETKATIVRTRTEIPKETSLKETRITPVPGGTITENIYETKGGTVTTPVVTGMTEIPGSSGWDKANAWVRQTLRLPSPEVGEKAVEIASMANPLVGGGKIIGEKLAFAGFGALGIDTREQQKLSESTQLLRGQYTQFYEAPLLAPLAYGAGKVLGTGARVLERGYIVGRAALAPQLVSGGTRTLPGVVERVGGVVMSRAPQVLTGLYAVDITGRATKGFTDISPESYVRLKGLGVQESGVMALGFGAPSIIAKKYGEARIGYKSLQQEIAGERAAALQVPIKPSDIPFSQVARYSTSLKVAELKVGARTFVSDIASGKTLGVAKINVKSAMQELPGRVSGFATYERAKLSESKLGLVDYLDRPYGLPPSSTFVIPESMAYDIGAAAYRKAGSSIDIGSLVTRARLGVSDLPYAVRRAAMKSWDYTPVPELKPRIIAPEDEYAFRYGESEGIGGVLSRINKIIPPSTYGEVQPRRMYLPQVGGEPSGKPAVIKEPGKPGTGFTRIKTTTISGRKISTLKPEPTFRSQGIKEPTSASVSGRPATSIGSRADYRGAPQQAMKPFDYGKAPSGTKQAAVTIQQMSEPLPMVEGMSARVAPQRYAMSPTSLLRPQGIETVQVIEPELEFTQERRTLYAVQIPQVAAQVPVSDISMKRGLDTMRDLTQRSRQDTAAMQIQRVRSEQKFDIGTTQESIVERAQREYRDTAFDITQDTRIGSDISVIPRVDMTTIQSIRTDMITDIITTPDRVITPEIIEIPEPPILPVFGGFGGGGGAKSDRRKLQLETAYIGPRSVRMIRPAGAPKLPWMKSPRAPAKAPVKKTAAKSRKKK